MKPALLVIGDCTVDQCMNILDSSTVNAIDPVTNESKMCFFHGSKVPVEFVSENLAGNAAHVVVGTAKLGVPSAIYTELGNDKHADNFISKFESFGVNTDFCRKNPGTTTNMSTVLRLDNERTIFSYHAKRDYKFDFTKLETFDWVYYTSCGRGYAPFQEKLLNYFKENPRVVVAFNPGTVQLNSFSGNKIDDLSDFLKITHVLFVNKQEAMKLAGISKEYVSAWELHEKLHGLGPKLTVITDGPKGASAYDGTQFLEQAASVSDKVVAKTGSGDAYAAAFLAALYYKKPLSVAMEWGGKNAANTLRFESALDGMLTKEDFESVTSIVPEAVEDKRGIL